MSPVFLETEDVLAIHADQLELYGGIDGLRDPGLLDSALAMPRQTFGGEYLHDTPFLMAAAYLFHIARNHPFHDGNKRTALASALVFLEDLNGHEIDAPPDALYALALGVAAGRHDKPFIAERLQGWIVQSM